MSSVPRSERIQGNLIRGLESCDKLINKIQGVLTTITTWAMGSDDKEIITNNAQQN